LTEPSGSRSVAPETEIRLRLREIDADGWSLGVYCGD